jgi:hypothetical protein
MMPHISRVIEEHDQLEDRLAKLTLFLLGDTFRGLDPTEQTRMQKQHLYMCAYLGILKERVRAVAP